MSMSPRSFFTPMEAFLPCSCLASFARSSYGTDSYSSGLSNSYFPLQSLHSLDTFEKASDCVRMLMRWLPVVRFATWRTSVNAEVISMCSSTWITITITNWLQICSSTWDRLVTSWLHKSYLKRNCINQNITIAKYRAPEKTIRKHFRVHSTEHGGENF